MADRHRRQVNKWKVMFFETKQTNEIQLNFILEEPVGRSVGLWVWLPSVGWCYRKCCSRLRCCFYKCCFCCCSFIICLRTFCWANRILAIAQSLTVVFFDYSQNSWLLWCWHSERKRDSETEQLVAAVCCYCCLLMNETCFKYKRRVLRNFNVEYKQFQIVVRDLVIQVLLLLLLLLLISILFFGGWSSFSCFFWFNTIVFVAALMFRCCFLFSFLLKCRNLSNRKTQQTIWSSYF